ncbi:hypothetical protein KIN20_000833 [Parelaphostrongylus tenuis]|uniref:Uncharacterized protein n=1 Tax=Parelaphostrongylus tenuis TaxID=148309 RepID=A0AAD5LSR8_PARTN|nr:hypothetical protein KIN20_000833 [Parelaphostrongylus tenuis]
MIRVVCPRCGSPSSLLSGSNPLWWSTARMKSSLGDALINRTVPLTNYQMFSRGGLFSVEQDLSFFRHHRQGNPCQAIKRSSLNGILAQYRRQSPHIFQYASECYITQGLQSAMEALHGVGLSWPYAFVVTGLALRVASSPLHILAEKLFARRLHAQNALVQGILKKLSQHYNVEVVPDPTRSKLELKTSDPKIKAHGERLLAEIIPQYILDHRLQSSRIQNLKMCTIPLWIYSSFAVRNIVNSDFHPSIPGGLWVSDMLAPDPYFILPVVVGLCGFLNLYSQRKIYPMAMTTWRMKSYDFILGIFTISAVIIMFQLPACIPLYWLSVSVSGFAQAQLLRHPSVKKLLGINRLPSDSRTPLRDLFLSRRLR